MTSHSLNDVNNGETLQQAYISLLTDEGFWQNDLNAGLRKVIDLCSQSLGVARVSIWRLEENNQKLTCQMLCDKNVCTLEPSLEVMAKDHPNYFSALISRRVVAAHDAIHCEITASFADIYLKPLGIGALLDATLRQGGQTIGVLCAEHMGTTRVWDTQEQHFITSVADLISQLITLHALYCSEERYRKVFDSTADAVLVMRDNAMVDCNQSALNMFGCTAEEFSCHPPKRFWADKQLDGSLSTESSRKFIEPALAGRAQLFEWRHRRFNGAEFDAEVSLNRIILNDEPHLIACIRDITERKASQNKIQQLLALQQAIFDGANYSIISTDLNGVIQSFNRAAEKLTGYLAREVIGKKSLTVFHDEEEIHWRAIELSEELNSTIEPNFQVFSAQPRSGKTEEREWTLISKSDKRVPVMQSITALSHKGKSISGFLCIGFDMTERKRANDQLLNSKRQMEYRANHDELTGLPNRSRLHDMTAAAIISAQSKKQLLAMMLIDLDRFKEVNDTLGHATGDKLLQKIGMRLNKIINSEGAHLYRLGGDEFAVLYPNPLGDNDIKKLTNQIHAGLRSPMQVDSITLELGGSIGVSIFPTHGQDSHSLLRCADVAMYKAKRESSRTIIYAQDQDAHSPRRLAMMAELGTAIRENQLLLHYQPKIRISDGKCVGCEALVRWHHPNLGLVPPGEFIPLAEMSDLIQPLGMWVLENAVKQIGSWRKQNWNFPIAVNLSTRNLMDSAFPSHIEKLLKNYNIPAELLEIEITESTLIGDPERALQIIDRIHRMGVRFAIDDFGTGYSSLGYLKRLPIDTLKIDRSFISDMLTDEQDRVIVQSTLGLAHSFGLAVVAEGVEDQETLDRLNSLGCEQAQGYLISRPIPVDEFNKWFRGHSVTH